MRQQELRTLLAGLAVSASIGYNQTIADATAPRDSDRQMRDTLFRSGADRPNVAFGLIADPKPEFPADLLRRNVKSGYARIAVSVSETGMLEDWIALEASEAAFEKAIDAVIWDWWFDPPVIDGEAEPVCNEIFLSFSPKLVETRALRRGESISDRIEFLHRNHIQASPSKAVPKSVRVYRPTELDKPLRPTHQERVVVPRSHLNSSLGSSVVFEFYIDAKGNVRIPSLQRIAGPVSEESLFAAQSALSQWKFEPPRVKGRKVTAKAAQRFTFD